MDTARVGHGPASVGRSATPSPEPTATATATEPSPAAPGKPQVVQGGWCSDELVDYMVQQSTSSEFKRGFGRPALLDGLEVGCSGVAKRVSFADHRQWVIIQFYLPG